MSGTTGSGKSLILETLQQRGEQVWEEIIRKLHFVSWKKLTESLFPLNGSLDKSLLVHLDDPFGAVGSS